MHSGLETNRDDTILLLWPIIFGLTLTSLRAIVLAMFGVRDIGGDHAIGLLLSVPGQVTLGLVIAVFLFWLRRSPLRHLIHLVVLVVVFLNVAAFHYEAVFWRLPGVSVLYYASEAQHLSSSAGHHAPWAAVVAETLLTWLVLTFAAERIIHGEERRFRGRAWRATLASLPLLSAVFTFVVILVPSVIPKPYLAGSRTPILWGAQSWNLSRTWTHDEAISRSDVLEFQRQIGHLVPFGGIDPRYPLCGDGPRYPERTGNGRSVIFLILESVGMDQIDLVHGGRDVMPELKRITSEATMSVPVKAAGSKSSQAMPALFAGIPPQPALHMLWRRPLNNIEGFPRILREHGYRSAYVHGGDLSFEQQRSFLRMAGFDELLEYDPSEPHPFLAWGYSDDVAFEKLREWIRAHRDSFPGRPYLGTVFTLSTHDPYSLPPERSRTFAGEGIDTRFLESLRFLDEQLGELYRWYLENEAPHGTVLVITGDHAPHLAGTTRLEDHEVTEFDVPMIVTIPGAGDTSRSGDPRGAHFDIPATILGTVGVSPGPCDQGLDLLATPPRALQDRALYAVAGDELEEFHAWFSSGYVHLDQATKTLHVSPAEGDGLIPKERAEELERRTLELYQLAGRISAYMASNDAYAPPPRSSESARAPVPRVARPRFIAHRGQSRGELPPEMQNSRAAVEQAISDGFEWIELDVQQSADQVPVVLHDYTITDAAGTPLAVSDLTVEEIRSLLGDEVMTLRQALEELGGRVNLLIEIKTPTGDLREASVLTLGAAALVKNRHRSHQIVMDTFSPLIAESLVRHCDCEVGLDAPWSKPVTRGWLEDAARSGMDWIYVHFRQASPELIRDAHAMGLRVLVYTVNDTAEITHLAREWPDAVITDRAALITEFEQRFEH